MLNPALIKSVLESKLDEILSGQIPEGFEFKSFDNNRVELVAREDEMFGIKCNKLHLVLIHKGVEIIFTNE